MKHPLAIGLLCWALAVQSAKSQVKTERASQAKPNDISLSLTGKWINHSLAFKQNHKISEGRTTYELVRAELNACLEMAFNSDFTGLVYTASECNSADNRSDTSFDWRIAEGILMITYRKAVEEKGGVLPTGTYAVKAVSGRFSKTTKALVLTDKKGVQYFLTRSED